MSESHYHDFYEIYISFGKEMRFFIGNQSYILKKNDIVLLDRFEYHKSYYPENAKEKDGIVFIFLPGLLGMINEKGNFETINKLFKIKKLQFQNEDSKNTILSYTEKIYSVYNDEKSSTGQLRAKLIFLEMLLVMCDMLESGLILGGEASKDPHEKRVAEIVTYLSENYRTEFTLDYLCGKFFINKYYLCHIFKESTGLSVIDFINRRRLAEAEKLLRYSYENVTKISQMVGFNNINHFINLFRKRYDCSPGEFRKNITRHNEN